MPTYKLTVNAPKPKAINEVLRAGELGVVLAKDYNDTYVPGAEAIIKCYDNKMVFLHDGTHIDPVHVTVRRLLPGESLTIEAQN